MYPISTDLASQHAARLLEDAERDRLANQARAARRRGRRPHRVRRTAWGRGTAAHAGTVMARVAATASRELG